MPIIAFDTLAYSNSLQKGGFTREQDETIASANAAALKEMVAAQELVTRKDLAAIKADLEKAIAATNLEIAQTRSDLEQSITQTRSDLEKALANTKQELIRWIVGSMCATATLIMAVFGVAIALFR